MDWRKHDITWTCYETKLKYYKFKDKGHKKSSILDNQYDEYDEDDKEDEEDDEEDDEANEDNYDYYRTIRQISIKSFQLSIQQ